MDKGTEFDHTSTHLDEDFEGYEEWLDETRQAFDQEVLDILLNNKELPKEEDDA